MRYFGFLARYVILPLLALRAVLYRERRAGKALPPELTNWPPDKALLAHAAVAVAYTTVWDNYLVYSGIWSYDRRLVTGVRLGWVPVEEYAFFVLQPLLTGSMYLWHAYNTCAEPPAGGAMPAQRLAATSALGAVWLASLSAIWRGGARLRYLSLITGWALPPIMLQTAFGGDILWRHRRLIASAVVPASLYLGLADSRAIRAGTWRITPRKTVGVDVMPHLPLEEFVFFCLTNLLLVFGITLVLSKESEKRLPGFLRERYERFKARYITGAS